MTHANQLKEAPLNSRGTLPLDDRRFAGKEFWRTSAMKRDLDAWLARDSRKPLTVKQVAKLPEPDQDRLTRAAHKRARKSVKLKLIRAAGGIR